MTERRGKGWFGKVGLPVSRAYLHPRSRRLMNWIGLAGVLAFAGVFLLSMLFRSGEFAAGGPLSSSHATFESDCRTCHRTLSLRSGEPRTGGADDVLCVACHGGTTRDLDATSFARHTIYASWDTTGLQADLAGHHALPCAACHPEHRGRDAAIVEVPDSRCLGCHPFGSFNKDHPEFDFRAEAIPDDSSLVFTHVRHSSEIDKMMAQAGEPCGYCHRADPEGMGFLPIEFDPHCGSCHLAGNEGTGLLPVRRGSDPSGFGVETLEMIQARGEPGTYWAHLANPNEYQTLGGGTLVKKLPVTHADPWILENLRQIRRRLYPDQGMAEALDTYGLASNESPKVLYREAALRVATNASALDARQELPVRQELARIRAYLNSILSRMARDDVFPSASPFFDPYRTPDPALTAEQRSRLFALADTLTSTCRTCHQVVHAAIARVQKDQSVLLRTRFDHGPHLLERDCLDCHSGIPMGREEREAFNPRTFDWTVDRSAIQNVPAIAVCRECHTPRQARNTCITCHRFHPARSTGPAAGRLP